MSSRSVIQVPTSFGCGSPHQTSTKRCYQQARLAVLNIHCASYASDQQAVVSSIAGPLSSRRDLLAALPALLVAAAVAGPPACQPVKAEPLYDGQVIDMLQRQAFAAYAAKDFKTTIALLGRIISSDSSSPRWYEMRGQVYVDDKDFEAAVNDFNISLKLTPGGEDVSIDKARLLSGRALAYEGLADWEKALTDYNAALAITVGLGKAPDPYVVNSRGNCHNSLGQWEEARADYLKSSDLFQGAKGLRGRNGSTTERLDGAIFAASNAALMLAQMGDEDAALREMQRVARRAPGSADMRAALAALYWARGKRAEAEGEWEFACDRITVGCRKYQDADWLRRIRRWPPVMVAKLQDFLQLTT